MDIKINNNSIDGNAVSVLIIRFFSTNIFYQPSQFINNTFCNLSYWKFLIWTPLPRFVYSIQLILLSCHVCLFNRKTIATLENGTGMKQIANYFDLAFPRILGGQ